jgi:hypothetical protein
MKRLVACLALFCATFQPAVSAADELTPAKVADIKQLLDLTGAYRLGQMLSGSVVRQMSETLRRNRPDLPPELFTVLAEEVNAIFAEEMSPDGSFADVVSLVYHNHFTHDEVRGLVAFYQTPLGRKLAAEMPSMTQESMQAGLKWGQGLAPKLQERLRARFRERGVEL